MSEETRFLFDECIGKPAMLQLQQILSTETTFRHICEHYQQGIKDSEWIPQIAGEGGWIVITADGGRNSKKGDKLPALCTANKLTHIVLSSKLHAKSSGEKIAAIALFWTEIQATAQEPPGTRFQLRYRPAKGSNILRLELCKVDVEQSDSE